jgi:predicted TIM-barrel fold metal-dependent hydrolase
MNVHVDQKDARKATQADANYLIADCDIHPYMKKPSELHAFLSQRWLTHLKEIGAHHNRVFMGGPAYPRMSPGSGMRADAWPKDGSRPGSDLALMQEQCLDRYGIEYGMLMVPGTGAWERNPEFAAALCTAMNDWQVAYWTDRDPRLKAGIDVPVEDADDAVAEIERRAGDRRFAHVMMPPRGVEPLGKKRYHKVLAACAANDLPVAVHLGDNHARAQTGGGWPSYYFEQHQTYPHSMEALVASFVFDGVFEAIPKLKLVIIEGGFSWSPPLCWRMDKHYLRMRHEVPHLKMLPSEYVKRNVWFTTQPMEEPERKNDLLSLFEWIGWDHVLFSSDYPHWDHDDPRYAFRVRLPDDKKRMILRDNAINLYGLEH